MNIIRALRHYDILIEVKIKKLLNVDRKSIKFGFSVLQCDTSFNRLETNFTSLKYNSLYLSKCENNLRL